MEALHIPWCHAGCTAGPDDGACHGGRGGQRRQQRQAGHNEAERLGIRHETTESQSAPGTSIKAVRLVNLPLTSAVVADAPTDEPLPEM